MNYFWCLLEKAMLFTAFLGDHFNGVQINVKWKETYEKKGAKFTKLQ